MTGIDALFAGVAVRNFAVAADWYTRLLGRSPDITAHEAQVMWRLADAAWLYVVADAARAGGALVSLSVADLDKAVAEVASRGITGGPVELVGTAGRKATFTDTEGNSVAFIEVAATAS